MAFAGSPRVDKIESVLDREIRMQVNMAEIEELW